MCSKFFKDYGRNNQRNKKDLYVDQRIYTLTLNKISIRALEIMRKVVVGMGLDMLIISHTFHVSFISYEK